MSGELIPVLTAFILIFLAELGDKTQICTIMLSSRGSALQVFLGAMLGFFIVDGLSALIGGPIISFLPHRLISFAAGLVFIVFGVIAPLQKSKKNESIENREATLLKTFSLVSLMELGDKTQLTSIFLAAQFGNPLAVLLGIMLAFTLLTIIGVFLGCKILRFIPEKYLKIGASAVFIILGLILIFEFILDYFKLSL